MRVKSLPEAKGCALARRGFTLIELLVVLVIIGMVAVLAVPAATNVMHGSQLTQSGQMVSDQLALARQTALSSNHIVEVRFYRYGDPRIPGEVAADPSTGRYRALQVFQIQDSGTATALGKIQTVSDGIIMDSGTALSSLLSPSQQKSWLPPLDPQINLPRSGTNYSCCFMRFLPDGSTNLPPASQWFVTLHGIADGDGLNMPSHNFLTLQIDATNGHLKNFRP